MDVLAKEGSACAGQSWTVVSEATRQGRERDANEVAGPSYRQSSGSSGRGMSTTGIEDLDSLSDL